MGINTIIVTTLWDPSGSWSIQGLNDKKNVVFLKILQVITVSL